MLELISADISMSGMLISYFICTVTSLLLGAVIAMVHMYRNQYSKNFILTLVILPAIIQAVIMLVNGNLGTGVAVMGAFSLVRFRSVPGNSREIASIFLAMATGLATGIGYIAVAVMVVISVGIVMMLLVTIRFGENKGSLKDLKITIPEDLDYEGLYDDLLDSFTKSSKLVKVKTINMGSLYELHYQIEFRPDKSEKEFIDEIRCRNGNLSVLCGRIQPDKEEL